MRWAVTIDPFLSLRAHVETRKKLQHETLALACASCSCITMRSCDCNSSRCRIVKEHLEWWGRHSCLPHLQGRQECPPHQASPSLEPNRCRPREAGTSARIPDK